MKRTIAAAAMAGTAALSLAACGSSAATPAGTATIPSASSPAATATSVSSCSVDCTAPIASGTSAWLAQVQAPLQQVSDDLAQISSDASSNPANLFLDGSQLAQDAQAVLNDEIDPAPVDNSDFVAAMNDYIAAGNDYSGDNSSGQQNPAQASQEIGQGNAALRSFQAANEGSTAAAAATAPASSAPASSAPAVGTTPSAAATASCASQVTTWYLATLGGKWEIAEFHTDWAAITSGTTVAEQHAAAHGGLDGLALTATAQPACDDPAHAWKAAMTDFGNAGETEYVYPGHCTVAGTPCAVSPVAAADAKAGFAELVIVAHEIDMYTPAQP
jgi:hypothetical protein